MTDLLNDAGKKHSYIIAPVIETRPKTTMIGVKLESDGKMIHICLSQRTLFQPRYLMIILAHEVGHYVGRYIHLRNKLPDGNQGGDTNEVFKTEYDIWCDEDDMLRFKLSQFVWVNELLEEYARACYVKIQERLSDQGHSAVICEIRQIYTLFGDSASEYDQIYEKISICVAEYRKMVRSCRKINDTDCAGYFFECAVQKT